MGGTPLFSMCTRSEKAQKGGFDNAKEKSEASAAHDTLPLLRSGCRYPTGSGDLPRSTTNRRALCLSELSLLQVLRRDLSRHQNPHGPAGQWRSSKSTNSGTSQVRPPLAVRTHETAGSIPLDGRFLLHSPERCTHWNVLRVPLQRTHQKM